MNICRIALREIIVILALSIVACTQKVDAPPANGLSAVSHPASKTSASTVPVTITTVKAQQRTLPVKLKATGSVTPLTSVDVRPQVTSVVTKVHFIEGQFVKAGQLLFTLDSRSDAAQLAKAKAQLAKDSIGLADTKRQLERSKLLFTQNFISKGAVDTAQAQVDGLAATVESDKAAIDALQVALSYARITAPSAGRVGVVNLWRGSAVVANQTTLVTITQLQPIEVTYSIPQRNLPDILSALKNRALVSATLADGGGDFHGQLQFVDNSVDASSGAVKVKAVFDNKDLKLWPGAYVDVSQTVATLNEATVIPVACIISSPRGTIVYAVEDGRAVMRSVKVVYSDGADAAITGIEPGDILVLDGKQNVRSDVPVVEKAKEAKATASGSSRQVTP